VTSGPGADSRRRPSRGPAGSAGAAGPSRSVTSDRVTYLRLARFAERLAGVNDLEAAVVAIRDGAAAVVDADSATLDVHGLELPDGPAGLPDRRARGGSTEFPLLGPEGDRLGTLRLAWPASVAADPYTRSMGRMLAQICALTLVRVRLADRAAALARVVAALAASRTARDVERLLTEHGRVLLGASHATVRPTEGASSPSPIAALADQYGAVAIRDNVPVWVPSPDGCEAFAALPIRGMLGVPIAVVAFAWSEPVRLDQQLRTVAASLADTAGPALERAMLYDDEHATLAALQRHLLGRPTTVDGLEVATRYLPGKDAVGIGGDWYDTVACSDGSLVVVVGDVAGHGVEAVAAMAQLQYLISGQVRTTTSLSRVFDAVNEMIEGDGGIYATAQLFHLDPKRHRLGYYNAGHPWALLRHADGRVDRLDGATYPPLGVAREQHPMTYVDFEPGALLVAYTDGLVERAEASILHRIDRLAGIVAAVDAEADVEEILATIVDTARRADEDGEPLDDDVAAVLVRG
jgi:serine phosphatase RsbU (regulator of sigma subunit)